MPQPLRIEDEHTTSLITTRTRGSALWFVRSPKFEERVLAYLAKYQAIYGAIIYAFVFQGNHYHLVARFPRHNRALFMRDLNSIAARLTKIHIHDYDGGTLWARRYSEQALPRDEDIEEYFFYCALQPVKAGLCSRPSAYKSYNSFYDAADGVSRRYKVVDWTRFHEKERSNSKLSVKDFTNEYRLTFSRLPGYEGLSQREYRQVLLSKLEERRVKLVSERLEQGLSFLPPERLRKTVRGSKPFSTKTSTRHSHRPLVLTCCMETKRAFLQMYFDVKAAFDFASKLYRKGIFDVDFPRGTYRPFVLSTG